MGNIASWIWVVIPLGAFAMIMHRNKMRYMAGQTIEDSGSGRKIELLSAENERLTGQIARLEERIAVLERIATDTPNRLSAEIDSLR